MKVELLVSVGLAILVVLSFVLILGLFVNSYLKWSEAAQRADELLRSVLNSDQYDQLMRNGYLDIKSPSVPGCIYRVPRAQGQVKVIEQGKLKKKLCLQPLELVPEADIVVMHKLMIEADEKTYLQTANTFTPITSSSWDD